MENVQRPSREGVEFKRTRSGGYVVVKALTHLGLWRKLFTNLRGGVIMEWARNYKSCIKCGTSSIPYVAKGLCTQCYSKGYRSIQANKEKARKTSLEWYYLNIDHSRSLNRKNRDRTYFANNRIATLERDKYQCICCGSTKKLTVHHSDGNSKYAGKPGNNGLSNLITLCRSCHLKHHHSGVLKARSKKYAERWARNYNCCIECGTTKRKHNSHGLCVNCYARKLRNDMV